MNAREIAKKIVKRFDEDECLHLSASDTEPDDVIVAKALLLVHKEHGCELRDPAGTIWEHAANIHQEINEMQGKLAIARKALTDILDQQLELGKQTTGRYSPFIYQIVTSALKKTE